MKREPSIHITLSKFRELWNDMGDSVSEDFLIRFFKKARGYSLDHRSLVVKSKKVEKEAVKRTQSPISLANTLADVIYSTRVKLKHIGVSKIKQTDSQWAQVKELVPIIDTFSKNYGLEYRSGCIEFVGIAFSLMKKSSRVNYNYCANWMVKNADWVVNWYESQKELLNDKYPQSTEELYDAYIKTILENTGIYNNYKDDPTKYIYFYRAKKLSDELGVDYSTFIEAQFEALSFCNGIPKIEDLCNDKARERLIKYASKQGIVLGNQDSTKPIDKSIWDSFKK